MNRYAIIVTLMCSLISVTVNVRCGLSQQWQREAAEFDWQFDYQKARQQAAESKKPLMVVFRCIP
jgi:hypothetical protein